MHRILLTQLKQETATFNPCPTTYDDFQVYRGPAVLSAYADTETEVAGALSVFSERHWEPVPTVAAASVSGGRVATADLDRLLDEILDAARKAGPVDGILAVLHGAMAGESEDDPEGALLARLREIHPGVPLVASLDLHAVLTDRMMNCADILVPYHTYPHTDHYSTGCRAARCLAGLLEGELQPITARVRLPMLVRGDELLTSTGKFGEAIGECQRLESNPHGIAAGVIIGNAFTDVPALQSNVVVTTNNDRALAEQTANRVARFMWEHRRHFQAKLTSLDEALRLAHATDGLVVFSDAADATASGAAGDSNVILRALVQDSLSENALRALAPIVDQPAVEKAVAAGTGAEIDVQLGATRDPTRFTPLPLRVQVVSLHDGNFVYEDGTAAAGGRVAVLRYGRIDVLATERPVYVVGRQVFLAHGLDPIDYDLVVVKSPNGFRTWYEQIAQRIVAVDAIGSTSANLNSLPFENCVRPIFPLDDDSLLRDVSLKVEWK